MEDLFSTDERLNFQNAKYPDATTFNKIHFNRAIQESLINSEKYNFENNTLSNFKDIFDYINEQINQRS